MLFDNNISILRSRVESYPAVLSYITFSSMISATRLRHARRLMAILLPALLLTGCGGGDPLTRARETDPAAVDPAAADVAAAVHAALPPEAVSPFDPALRPAPPAEATQGEASQHTPHRDADTPEGSYPSLRFLLLSDIHHLSPSLWEPGLALARFLSTNDGKVLARSAELLAAIESTVLAEHSREALDFAVITGDLTTNGAPESHRDVAELASRLDAAGVPTFVIPGNHDLNNPWARRFPASRPEVVAGVTPREFRRIHAAAGYDRAVSQGPDDLSYRVDIDQGAALFLLDSAIWRTNQELGYPQPAGEIGTEQRRWLERELAAAREAGLAPLVFMHHPVLNHDPALDYGTRQYRIGEAAGFLELMRDFRIPMLFSGHLHVRKTTVAAENAGSAGNGAGRWVFDIAAGAVSIYPHEYRIVTIRAPQQELRITPRRLSGFADPDFRRWSLATYLSDFAGGYVPRLREEAPEEEEQIPADALGAMAHYLGMWELQHRDGIARTGVLDHIVDAAPPLQRGREAWMRFAPARYRDYAAGYGSDPAPPNREIVIDLARGGWRPVARAEPAAQR